MFKSFKEKLKVFPKWTTIIVVVALIILPLAILYYENNIQVRHFYYSSCQDERVSHRNIVTKVSGFWLNFDNLSWSENYSVMEFYKDREKDNWFQLPKFHWIDPYTGFMHRVDMKNGFVGLILFRLELTEEAYSYDTWVPIIIVNVVT